MRAGRAGCAGETLTALRAEAEEVVCLATPEPFQAVGPHYRDSRQTIDSEAIELLEARREAMTA